MSDRSTVHQTSTVIEALLPGRASKPDVSTVTRMFVQCRLSLASAAVMLCRSVMSEQRSAVLDFSRAGGISVIIVGALARAQNFLEPDFRAIQKVR